MKNDIMPPPRPKSVLPAPEPAHVVDDIVPPETPPVRHRRIFSWKIMTGVILMAVVGVILLIIWWYNAMLQPVDPRNDRTVIIVVRSGATSRTVLAELQRKQLIRSAEAFELYLRLHGQAGQIQTGSYAIAPSMTASEITRHLISGKNDTFNLTFFPGATLLDNSDIPEAKRTDVVTILRRAGFEQAEIDAALKADYHQVPLFRDKPLGTGLEGYVFGETYNFEAGASVTQVLHKTFDEYYRALQDNQLIEAYQKRGLTLYQAITLASIVQREVSDRDDMNQVAQVFLKRLEIGMPLGSDVTFIYAANQLGVAPRVSLDSPYNTRKYTGLPPGPIATPGISALRAVAYPAPGDYLFFVAGDDGKTYFGRTEAEHNANIKAHCYKLCDMF